MVPPSCQEQEPQMLRIPPHSTVDGEVEEKNHQERPDHTPGHEGALVPPLVSCDSIW